MRGFQHDAERSEERFRAGGRDPALLQGAHHLVEDVVTAQDSGALPDRSVNEALQRVAGVAITRFAAATEQEN